jgi:hypothetical protein
MRTMRRAVAFVGGVASLLLAVAILVAGYWWGVFVWSGGEYAEPPPSLGHKIWEVFPWALGAVVLAAIPAITGVVLIGISRRSGDSHRIRAGERGRA